MKVSTLFFPFIKTTDYNDVLSLANKIYNNYRNNVYINLKKDVLYSITPNADIQDEEKNYNNLTSDKLLIQLGNVKGFVGIEGPYLNNLLPPSYFEILDIFKYYNLNLMHSHPCINLTVDNLGKHVDYGRKHCCAINITLQDFGSNFIIYDQDNNSKTFNSYQSILFLPGLYHELNNNTNNLKVLITFSILNNYDEVYKALNSYVRST